MVNKHMKRYPSSQIIRDSNNNKNWQEWEEMRTCTHMGGTYAGTTIVAASNKVEDIHSISPMCLHGDTCVVNIN